MIGVLLGLLFNLLRISSFTILDRTLDTLTSMTTPLALLSIGASFNFERGGDNIRASLLASSLKLLVFPLIMISLASLFSLSSDQIMVLYVAFGVPTAVNSYPMTLSMGGDGEMISSIILYTTLFSVLSMTVFIFAFTNLGWL